MELNNWARFRKRTSVSEIRQQNPSPQGEKSRQGRKEEGAQLRIVAVGCSGSLDLPLIQSFSRHLLSTTCMLDLVLGNAAGNRKHRVPAPGTTDIPARELDST